MRRKKEAQKTIIILKTIFEYQRLALKSPTDNWFLIFDPSSVEKFPCQVDTYGPWLSATLSFVIHLILKAHLFSYLVQKQVTVILEVGFDLIDLSLI